MYRQLITNVTQTRNIKRWVSPTLRELKRRKDRNPPQQTLPKSSFLDWNHQAELYAFGRRLNENFNKQILQNALTNRSYVIQQETIQETAGITPVQIGDNSKLIHQGEQFIMKSVREHLKQMLPKFPEDGINAVCTYLTSNENLGNVGMLIGLKDLILSGEYPPNETTLSQSFKAVIGALVESSGDSRAQEFVRDFVVLKQLSGKDVNTIWNVDNPLDLLTEQLGQEVESRLCNHSGGGTILATYQVGLYLEKQCVGLGWGENVEIAVEMAARDGLKRIFGTSESCPGLQNISPQTEQQHQHQNVI